MLCEHCHAKEATVHVKQIFNGDTSEKNLCEHCARQSGEMNFFDGTAGGVNLGNLLAGFMNLEPTASPTKLRGEVCPTCGSDFRRFSQGGRLGCADCYGTFSRQLHSLLKRIHGTTVHHGKVPQQWSGKILRKRQLADLRRELKEAVEQERFERAAEVRDQIRRLEAPTEGK